MKGARVSLAVVMSRSLDGFEAPPVRVEVHLANGLPNFMLVGLADTEVKEARERVRAALAQSGFTFPHNKRVTVNLAPADLPKESGRFDLPIALGILAAGGVIDSALLQGCEFAGELSLAGELQPVRGALALALAVRREAAEGKTPTLVLPARSAAQAACVPGVDVRAAADLAQVVASLWADGGPAAREALPRAEPAESTDALSHGPDLSDVRGQSVARRALEIAAAGGHSLLMVGPPGSGKSMLAQRLVGILPPMTPDEALTQAALAGLGRYTQEMAVSRRPPFRSPHHSASAVALVGGGSPPRPGEISLAHSGVLFLDELPEFPRMALEALREPLESGQITISRAGRQAQFPARFQLVGAMNPCPCGWHGAAAGSARTCRCAPDQILRYQSRLSGPLLDRIDLLVDVPALPPCELLEQPPAESSAAVANRVEQARARQQARQGMANVQLDGQVIQREMRRGDPALQFVRAAAERFAWSGRAVHRVLKVARTIADLAASPTIEVAHVAEAVQYRRALGQ